MASITVVGTNANPPKPHPKPKQTGVTVFGEGFATGFKVNVTVTNETANKIVIGPVAVNVDSSGQFRLGKNINRVADGTQLLATAEQTATISLEAETEVASEL
jgi:hypothetical protein